MEKKDTELLLQNIRLTVLNVQTRQLSNYYCDNCNIQYDFNVEICEKCGKEFKYFDILTELRKDIKNVFIESGRSEEDFQDYWADFIESFGKGLLGTLSTRK
ncbi:MAG: hypothetical protein ACFE9V_18795 [Candidatus Hodarchaeota archaeon]